ncbi:hypothetical protein [Microbacterium sp.]|uniref:hypothetical protein n=1 Tax=Microbacterium sp. TaxID=51671 RepID=UPI0025E5C35A|nr:hypothetical protein [Microbacterium sp.]MBT9607014.1 hypothetical protein [Microbacterium sp.]
MSGQTKQCRFSALPGLGMQSVTYRGDYVGSVRRTAGGWEAIRRRGGPLPGMHQSRAAAATALVDDRQQNGQG